MESGRVNTADAPAPAASNPPAAGMLQCPGFVMRFDGFEMAGRTYMSDEYTVSPGGEGRPKSNPPCPPLTGGYKSDAAREGDWGLDPPAPAASNPPAAVGFYPAHLAGQAVLARGGGLMDAAEKMKIMVFSVNTDKFTGFFDKFPKTDERGGREEIGMNSNGYGDIIMRVVNILSKFLEIKSFFRPPHFPATARICPRRIMPANPPAPAGGRSLLTRA